MFISTITAVNYWNAQKKVEEDRLNGIENFTATSGAAAVGMSFSFVILIFLLDIAMFIYALTLALDCPVTGTTKILYLLLAFFFPLFFIIFHWAGVICKSKKSGEQNPYYSPFDF